MPRTLTAANAIIVLSAPDVFPSPHQLQGFSTDDVFGTESVDTAETQMGVDGKLSAGYVFRETKMNYNLQADSLSIDWFENLQAAQKSNRTVYPISVVVTLKDAEKTYTGAVGYLTTYSPTPAAGKTLKPRVFGVTYEDLSPSPA